MQRLRQAAAAFAAVVIVAACSSAGPAGSPAPSTKSSPAAPSPSPTLAPTPTPPPPAPTPPTQTVESNRFPYSIVIPAHWTPSEMGAADLFSGTNEEQVDVRLYSGSTADVGEDQWFDKARTTVAGFGTIDNEGTTSLAGMPARWYEAHVTDRGRKLFLIRVTAYDKPDGWDLTWVSPAGAEAGDRSRFKSVFSSYQRSDALRNVWKLAEGQCFQSLPISEPAHGGKSVVFVGPVDGFLEVSCDTVHTGEVVAAFAGSADFDCDGYFKPYVGRALTGSTYEMLTFLPLPTHASAERDGTDVRCVVADSAGQSEGTAKASAR